MAHGYRNLQHWEKWLSQQFFGAELLAAEEKQLGSLLERHFGRHAGLIGVPRQQHLLNAAKIPCHTLITPLLGRDSQKGLIEGDLHDLPILTGSMDLILLPHTLEFIDNPRQLLSETCRVIKPEGLIVICGFNPYSLWGLKKLMARKNNNLPSGANFIQTGRIVNWLRLADFSIERQETVLFTTPVDQGKFSRKLNLLEKFGSKWFPIFGNIYIIIARAKVIPLTPIRLKWKQQLSGVHISNTIPGNIARQSK